ncbi:MAG TPA: hypothetical protein VFW33_20720 [Gemmataceae bacterium]|nr:hypothetical protein [Gemmataceae bacterium]
MALAVQGRGLPAIYLWGYSAEMTVKAAYFAFIGFADEQPIAIADLANARAFALSTLGIVWPSAGWGHNVACWAELLVAHRVHAGQAYRSRHFRSAVVRNAWGIYLRWRETLRYHRNRAYGHEVMTVRGATRWLLDNSTRL